MKEPCTLKEWVEGLQAYVQNARDMECDLLSIPRIHFLDMADKIKEFWEALEQEKAWRSSDNKSLRKEIEDLTDELNVTITAAQARERKLVEALEFYANLPNIDAPYEEWYEDDGKVAKEALAAVRGE